MSCLRRRVLLTSKSIAYLALCSAFVCTLLWSLSAVVNPDERLYVASPALWSGRLGQHQRDNSSGDDPGSKTDHQLSGDDGQAGGGEVSLVSVLETHTTASNHLLSANVTSGLTDSVKKHASLHERGENHSVRERMAQREQRVQSVCRQTKFRSPAITDNLIIDRKHSVVWCPIFKAGSTNWLQLLCQVNHVRWTPISGRDTGCPIQALRSHFPHSFLDRLIPSRGTHFLIVRHPLERLLSAYRDKILGGNPLYRKKSLIITTKQRKNKWSVHSAADALENRGGVEERLHEDKSTSDDRPTFAEFLRSVSAVDVVDEHWKPYYALCSPCRVHYTLIGKFETLDEDQAYIMNVTGLRRYGRLPHYSNHNQAGHSSTLRREYFSQVTKQDLLNFYKVFKLDFLMFNYTLDEYMGFAKSS